jgi:hypothetical protein
MNEYLRRKPNPIVDLIRVAWLLFVAALIAVGIVALTQMLTVAWWWMAPILVVLGFAAFVLYRNRRS